MTDARLERDALAGDAESAATVLRQRLCAGASLRSLQPFIEALPYTVWDLVRLQGDECMRAFLWTYNSARPGHICFVPEAGYATLHRKRFGHPVEDCVAHHPSADADIWRPIMKHWRVMRTMERLIGQALHRQDAPAAAQYNGYLKEYKRTHRPRWTMQITLILGV